MLHLIKLELKKGRMGSYVWGPLLACLIICGFMTLVYFTTGIEQDVQLSNYESMLFMGDTFTRATFIIYASVLLAKLIVSEYQNRTIALLFTYPVSRKKLITAKLTMVFFWALACMLITNLLVSGYVIVLNTQFNYISEPLTIEILGSYALNVVMQDVAAAGMSLLPLVVGLWRKSVPATVVSSIAIVAVVCSNNGGFTLSSIIVIPLTLAALGIFLTYLSFRKVDLVDVE